ncbi:MAG: MBL fold metallo-hydrolase, partial [Mycolicibacterium sp.]|nr:MBL fold metallo-hydrolase [Mycolicibacterium sp.]
MNEIVLGDVSVTRVMEYFGSVELSPSTFFPDSS